MILFQVPLTEMTKQLLEDEHLAENVLVESSVIYEVILDELFSVYNSGVPKKKGRWPQKARL